MKSISPVAQAAIAAVGLSLIVILLLQIPFFGELENVSNDENVSVRYDFDRLVGHHLTDSRIVVAAIDARTLQDLGAWPLPRTVHGEFLAVLAPEKPALVGWDVFFTEETNATDDGALVQGASAFPHMVVAAELGQGTSQPFSDDASLLPTRPFTHIRGDIKALSSTSEDADLPIPALRRETYFGFSNEPGRVRRVMPLVVNINGRVLPSFDCQLMMQYWGIGPDQVTVDLGHAITFHRPDGKVLDVPIDQHGLFNLNYRGRLEDFTAMSYGQMGKGLADKLHHTSSEERSHLPAIQGKILVVGVTAAGVDQGPIPIRDASPLVVTHLNVLNNILQRDFLHVVPGWIWVPLYALGVFFLALWMMKLRVVLMLLVDLMAGGILAACGFLLLYAANVQIPVAMPEIGLILLGVLVPSRGFFGEEREKAKIKGIMQAYLSDKVMQKVLAHPDNLKLGGVKQVITIMFCDIRGFTAYCDERDPQETMDVLNEYMETMTQVVFDHDGTIDKYIGDCIMAFWNAPEPQADHALKAVQCAMNMRLALEEFKHKRRGTELENFECGIGIHTGEALVGNMGSSLKRNYTAMGSSVNLASRLESLTKKLGERIIFSQDTLDLLQGDLPIIDRGEHSVAGVGRPVHVYAVVSQEDYNAALQGSAEVYADEASSEAIS